MPFKIYQATPDTAAGGWRLRAPLPLRFSGPQGIIARHVRTLAPDAEGQAWALCENDIVGLALPVPSVSDAPAVCWLVFEQTEGGGALRLSRLCRVRGISATTTELLFTFSPLAVLPPDGTDAEIRVSAPSNAREWSEELSLNGGLAALNGPWTWGDRALNIGAAVIGAH
jgi:hypothetical protein